MEALPYFLSFAVICFLVSFGLFHRKVWVWYCGWVFFYILASYFGTFFVNGLYEAKNQTQVVYACLYLAGGLFFWLPFVVWWANQRSSFGIRPSQANPSADV